MSTYHEPNKKGPRFRRNFKRVLNQEFFKRLRKEYPDLMLSVKDVHKIIETFHELCREVISTNRDGLELPEQLGHVFVAAFKINLRLDQHFFYIIMMIIYH